jgi:HK97 gp10 family phage protein
MAAAHWVRLNEKRAALKRLPEHLRDRLQKTSDVTAFQVSRLISQRMRRRTGKMAAAVTWKSRPSTLSAIVGIDKSAFYWKFWEYGTVKMEARPSVRPAKEAMAADHDARLTQAILQSQSQMELEAQ